MPAGPALGAWVRLGTSWNLLLTFIRTLQTGSCLSLEVAHVINEIIVLRVKQTKCVWQCAASTDVTYFSQQLSHRAKAIFWVRSYTFNPWLNHPTEIFAMAYFLWELVVSSRFKITVQRVTCFVNDCEIQPVTLRKKQTGGEVFTLLGCYTSSLSTWLPAIRENLVVPSSR